MSEIKLHWYQTGWGVIMLGILGIILVIAGIFAFFIGQYWWQIKHGQSAALAQKFYAGFSQSGAETKSQIVKDIESVNEPYLGNPNAPITIVEFVDFKCPNCKAAEPIMQELLSKYAFKVKLVARDFPSESLHPGATQLSRIAWCGHAQNKYWETQKYFFDNQDNLPVPLSDDGIKNLADSIGLTYNILDTCLKDNRTNIKVERDYADGYLAGVAGTPTFFVNGEKIEGVVPLEVWVNYIKNYK